MNRKLSKIVLIILTIACFCLCQFDVRRLKVVHKTDRHALVRGNLPIIDNKFQFQTLYKSLGQLTGLKKTRIIIFSLLNLLTAKQTKNRYIQQNYFNEQGQIKYDQNFHYYFNHDIIGSYFSPAQFPSFLKKYALKYYQFVTYDKIPQLLQKIQMYMNSPFPSIIYVHCSQGIDRSGYIAGAYKMKYLNKSLTEVVKQNLQIMKDVRSYIHFNSFNGMQWYCLFLKRSQQQCLVGVQGASRGNTLKSKQQKNKNNQKQQHKQAKKDKQL